MCALWVRIRKQSFFLQDWQSWAWSTQFGEWGQTHAQHFHPFWAPWGPLLGCSHMVLLQTELGSACSLSSKVNLLKTGCGEESTMFIAGSSKNCGQFKIKRSELLDGFSRKEFLKAKFGVRVAGCVSFFGLVGGEIMGWCSGHLVLSLKLPSSLWARALVPLENFKDIFVCVSLEEEPGLYLLLLYCCTAFLCFCIPLFPN